MISNMRPCLPLTSLTADCALPGRRMHAGKLQQGNAGWQWHPGERGRERQAREATCAPALPTAHSALPVHSSLGGLVSKVLNTARNTPLILPRLVHGALALCRVLGLCPPMRCLVTMADLYFGAAVLRDGLRFLLDLHGACRHAGM